MQWIGLSLRVVIVLFGTVMSEGALLAQDPPALPPGLETADQQKPGSQAESPVLPEGLGDAPGADRPPLPSGLDDTPPPPEESEKPSATLPPGLSGFLEGRAGLRTQNDPHEKTAAIAETRLQLQLEQSFQSIPFKLSGDFLYDPVMNRHGVDLENGEGFIDLREANALFRPGEVSDIKIGRQILTWGTGDLIFINDLFPKDWNAFFIGRDSEYLKAPSDALKASIFSAFANLDLVYTPRFDPDRFIDGRRISYFNAQSGRRAGRDAIIQADIPDRWFSDEEIAWRLYRNLSGLELALYGYQGYWKSPGGFDPNTGRAIFPALAVYGASARKAIWRGIGNVETGYYDSKDDPDGENPLIRNGEVRFLAGYEQELVQDLTAGIQYYLEHMLDHADYALSLPSGSARADQNRHVLTLRLTQLLLNQDLRLSVFTFYSPSDEDAYLRPKAAYKIDDFWSLEFGGNLFFGRERHTFFSQFENNSNVYAAVRYGF